MDGRKQEQLGSLVGEIFRAREKHPRLMVNVLRHHWPAIVGEELAAKTYPAQIKRKILWVNTVDASWAYQLQFLKGEILQSAQAFLQTAAVAEVRFRMGEVSPLAAEMRTETGAGLKDSPGQPLPESVPGAEGAPQPPPPEAAEPPPHPAIADPALRLSFSRWLAGQKRKKRDEEPLSVPRKIPT